MDKKYMNPALRPEERAQALLEEMSLEEKVAQMNCVFPFDKICYDFDAISEGTRHGIGEVSTLEMRRMETLEEVAAWQKKVQEIVMENSEHNIPAIFHMEGLCGAFIQDSTSFPSGIGRGASFDPELEEKIAKIVSRQEAACGITHVLAPILDLSRDPRMGRQGEAFLHLLWVWHIRKESRMGKRPGVRQRVWQSISLPFIILRAGFTGQIP